MPQKIAKKLEIHGDVRVDDYFWMNDRDDPRVIDWLERENARTDAVMAPLAELERTLFEEMKARIPDEDSSAPYRDGEYWYYHRYAPGQEYPVYCRRYRTLDAVEQVLLDVNRIARGHDYYAVRNFAVSPDHRIAAYGVDTRGRRHYTLHFLDLETGEALPDRIEDVTANFEWANDSRTVFYTQQEAGTLRWHQVRRFRLGDRDSTLVYEETDETNWLWLEKSLSSRYLFLVSAATVSTEVRYLPADAPESPPTLFLPREAEHEYYVTDGVDRFYVLTNDRATNFRVVEVPLDNTAKNQWRELVAHRDDVMLEGFDVFSRHIAVSGLNLGVPQMEVIERSSGRRYPIEFDEEVFTAYSEDNYCYDTPWFRYTYESMTTPESTYDFNFDSREHRLIKQATVLGGFDRHNYVSHRLWAPARDGVRIPVSIVYRKGLSKNGRNPLLQYGYGAYGITVEPDFDADLLSLLDRGFVFAIAHVRGGSMLGRDWYYGGRQLQKRNSFHDFIDVSRYLIDEGYTSPAHLYAQGGSAGGLLMGGIVNMAPELYRGIVARVPFVDIVTTMLDASIPLTTGEYDEWGDPHDRTYYEYMLSYSPYDNVGRHAYPNMLVTTGLHDSQVQYWEPAKWVAKLLEYRSNDNLLLLKTDMQAGHSGKTGRFRSLEDTTLYYAFFLHLEGIHE